jgi:outer membrane receptor protein involved in Fe transport
VSGLSGLTSNNGTTARNILYNLSGSIDNIKEGFDLRSSQKPVFLGYADGVKIKERDWHDNEVTAFFKDTWKVTSNLTLNLGVRFEHFNSMIQAATLPAGRFVPATLPEWSTVDTSAAVWAVRHYRSGGLDPTSPLSSQQRAANHPDTLALATTVNVVSSPTSPVVAHYYSRHPDLGRVTRDLWEVQDPTFAPGPPGATRITVTPRSNEAWSTLAFVMLAILGHAIYL